MSLYVCCEICHRSKYKAKYKRHLLVHKAKGEVSTPQILKILFESRYTRSDSNIKQVGKKFGGICSFTSNHVRCSAIVLNLRKHLIRVHSLLPTDEKHIQIMKNSGCFQREICYKNNNTLKLNPLHNFKEDGRGIITTNDIDIQCSRPSETLEQEQLTHESSPFDFISESGDESEILDCLNLKRFIPNISQIISDAFLSSFREFKTYLSTFRGGSRSENSLKCDISNLISLFNVLGEDGFFNPQRLNDFMSKEHKDGKSPSTLHSRLNIMHRFVDFLKLYDSTLLPDIEVQQKLISMINGIKKSVSRLKFKRQKEIMTKSRENFNSSVKTLKDWRNKREDCNLLNIFKEYSLSPDKNLNVEIYNKLRDYLIVELIIPNAQRPGVIHGMKIKEIQNAKYQITPEGYHLLMVSEHKTGYVQCATLFIYPEIYEAIDVFINVILPKLPNYISNSLHQDSSVFKTYSGVVLPSSQITPILQKHLSRMGIDFNGTATDLRKCAATLTGKFRPEMHELMALFMGHSRKCHDKYYRVHLGHSGLTEAFKCLETFQTHPDVDSLNSPCKPQCKKSQSKQWKRCDEPVSSRKRTQNQLGRE